MTVTRCSTTSSPCPTTFATRSGASSRRGSSRADSAGLLVCGMGGSAIGGDLAAAALGERLTRPMVTVRGYALPSWVGADWTVLCSSYSGETEETLACFEAATAARRPAHRRRHRRAARRPGPRGRASRSSACPGSCSRGRRSPTCSSPPPRRRRWPASRRGSRPRSRTPRPCSSSATEDLETARGRDRRAPRGHAAGDLRRRADRAGRPALEDPDQREREAAGLLLRAARGRPQRDLRLGRVARGHEPLGRHARGPPSCTRASGVASSSPPRRSPPPAPRWCGFAARERAARPACSGR